MTSTVLAILAETRAAESTLAVAAAAAQALSEARIEVLHVRVDPSSTIVIADEILTQAHREVLEAEAAAESVALKALFDRWNAARPAGVVPAAWLDPLGTITGEIEHHARGAALVVIGKLGAGSRGHARAAFHAALFRARSPVLMVPRRAGAAFGRHLAIGWKDTETTRRAVTAARPWLATARVSVIRVSDHPDEDLGQARWLLGALGIAADWHVVPFGGASAGLRLLAEAQRLGTDGIVLGAFGRNRIVEWIFGGVTHDVIEETLLPVLMRH